MMRERQRSRRHPTRAAGRCGASKTEDWQRGWHVSVMPENLRARATKGADLTPTPNANRPATRRHAEMGGMMTKRRGGYPEYQANGLLPIPSLSPQPASPVRGWTGWPEMRPLMISSARAAVGGDTREEALHG